MQIDLFLRNANLILEVLLIITLARNGGWRHLPAQLAIAYLAMGVMGSIHTAPAGFRLDNSLTTTALFLSIPSMGLGWWLALALLQDSFKMSALEWAGMLFACYIRAYWAFYEIEIGVASQAIHTAHYYATYALGLLFRAHIIWIAASGLRNDLVALRRSVRYWFVLSLAGAGMLSAALQVSGVQSDIRSVIDGGVSIILVLWAFLWLTQRRPDFILLQQPPTPTHQPHEIDVKDAEAYARLTELMEEQKVYTEFGLTIQKLAVQVGVPEHQLRSLINRTMGYRNFPAYLNGYRLAYAKSVLANPHHARLPILTIAMDSGYQTLSTFNRAFKNLEGETPSEFRAHILGATSGAVRGDSVQ